ncbi:MAG: hypothetical protein AAF903_12120 [Pseudomonadota bacterium]
MSGGQEAEAEATVAQLLLNYRQAMNNLNMAQYGNTAAQVKQREDAARLWMASIEKELERRVGEAA